MKNRVQTGKSITVTAGGTVASGSFQLVGAAFGVAATSASTGEEYELHIGDVYELPKATGVALAILALVYWDAAAGKVTNVSSGNTKIGVAARAAGSSDTSMRVRLNDCF